jgi:bis(5'-nucleosyl)-tetraphosphatase (symmetrical)
MARIAIGDLQGCFVQLESLLKRCDFSPDRDQLWFVGDLVNRGPDSLRVLRFVRSLGDGARVVLGNHDLHLLALAFGARSRKLRKDDTLDDILQAPDRQVLLEWLLRQPLAVAEGRDLMVHAGIVPQWSSFKTLELASEVSAELQRAPEALFENMYGDEPVLWSETLTGYERARFVINVLTRMRYCTDEGRIDLRMKGAPGTQRTNWKPWFEVPSRQSAAQRIIFGHWSTLGLQRTPNILALDTGCVWGGCLTAVSLDDDRVWQIDCPQYQAAG